MFGGGYVIDPVCTSLCFSVGRIQAKVISRFRWNLVM